MKHSSKEFWNMIELAKQNNCKVVEGANSIKVIPPDKNLQMYTCHEGERGIHPLRRYLKNVCKISI